MQVRHDSVADKAGIEEGDIVMAVDGKTVESGAALTEALKAANEVPRHATEGRLVGGGGGGSGRGGGSRHGSILSGGSSGSSSIICPASAVVVASTPDSIDSAATVAVRARAVAASRRRVCVHVHGQVRCTHVAHMHAHDACSSAHMAAERMLHGRLYP